MIPNKTNKQLKKLAIDVVENKIFTDRHVSGDNATILLTIFLPIGLGGLPKEKAKEVGMIYEYYDQAGPRAINGYPMFNSCFLINKKDTTKLFTYMEEYKKQKEIFLGEIK